MRKQKKLLAAIMSCFLTFPVLMVAAAGSPIQEEIAGVARASVSIDPETATEEYLARQTPEEKARSVAYWNGGYWVSFFDFLLVLIIGWLLLRYRFSERMRLRAERFLSRPTLVTIAYSVQYIVVTSLLSFPFLIYANWYREHQYGLSTQGFGPWFGERLIELGLSLFLMTVLIVAIYGVIRRAPRTWWA